DGSGWSDAHFRQIVDRANAERDSAARMRKLAACEERLLRAMPVLPVFFDSYSYLQKPYVTGLRSNVLDVTEFRAGWMRQRKRLLRQGRYASLAAAGVSIRRRARYARSCPIASRV